MQKKDNLIAAFQKEQLHVAAAHGDVAEVDRLLAAKYPVNRFDVLGKTPLHYAAAGEQFDVVDRLLRAGANVNANDEEQSGNSPLADIAENCSFEMAKTLMAAGANPAQPGWMQLTAIDRADRRKDKDAAKIQKLFRDSAGKR